MKESTATIGDGRTDGHDDRTGSECFPCRWPEINQQDKKFKMALLSVKSFIQLDVVVVPTLRLRDTFLQ